MVDHDAELLLFALPDEERVVGVTARVRLLGGGVGEVLGRTLEVLSISAVESEGDALEGGLDGSSDAVDVELGDSDGLLGSEGGGSEAKSSGR